MEVPSIKIKHPIYRGNLNIFNVPLLFRYTKLKFYQNKHPKTPISTIFAEIYYPPDPPLFKFSFSTHLL